MSYDKFVIYPGNTFKTADKLAEYKAFFEPKLEIKGLKVPPIEMAISKITRQCALIVAQGDVDKSSRILITNKFKITF
ncbi:Aminopeptidase N [Lactococcus lactis]|nr:Aminopeptidase N [Lactococcus lactis]